MNLIWTINYPSTEQAVKNREKGWRTLFCFAGSCAWFRSTLHMDYLYYEFPSDKTHFCPALLDRSSISNQLVCTQSWHCCSVHSALKYRRSAEENPESRVLQKEETVCFHFFSHKVIWIIPILQRKKKSTILRNYTHFFVFDDFIIKISWLADYLSYLIRLHIFCLHQRRIVSIERKFKNIWVKVGSIILQTWVLSFFL